MKLNFEGPKYMFNHHHQYSLPLILLSISLLFHSCIESPEVAELESSDKGFSEAQQIIEEHIRSINTSTANGQQEQSKWVDSKKSITLLKYVPSSIAGQGELQYNTNRDEIEGFQPITEETITAFVEPGEFVFWYISGGLEELAGIEFVPEAQEELGELPSDLDQSNMWYVWVPENAGEGDLKYDILYRLQSQYNSTINNELIRLDPVVHVLKPEDNGDNGDNGDNEG